MKSNYLKIGFLFLFIILGCSACNGNITRDIRHAGYSISGDFNCPLFIPSKKDDTSYEKIKYYLDSHVITTEGKIYELSLSQKYSSGENCRKAELDIKVDAILDGTIVKAEDGKYYSLVAQNNVPIYSEIAEDNGSFVIYDLLLKDSDVVKATTVSSNEGIYYVLKTDGNVYKYVISKASFDSLPAITSISIAYDKNDYGDGIVDYNYGGDQSLSTFVRTNSKLYRVRSTNLEECSKYVDVECKYKMKEDPIFEEYKDVIIAFNGNTLITNYSRMFSVSN